jgi:hypothetical protein
MVCLVHWIGPGLLGPAAQMEKVVPVCICLGVIGSLLSNLITLIFDEFMPWQGVRHMSCDRSPGSLELG